MRHRPGPSAHQGRSGRRWNLQDQRREDLDFRRRTGSHREHHPSGAGAYRRGAGWRARHQPGWNPGRAQRGDLRGPGREDGHSRQRHLRHDPRGGDRLAGGRREPGPGVDVRDDERGAPGRRPAGPRPGRGGLSGGGAIRQGAAAGPLAHRAEERRRPGRSDPGPSRRAPHADGRPRRPGRGPRPASMDRPAGRSSRGPSR